MRTLLVIAAIVSLLIVTTGLAAREACAYTALAPDPLNGKTWSTMNAHDREVTTQAILSGFQDGWITGYASRTVRSAPAMDTKASRSQFMSEFMRQEREDQPRFSQAPSVYASRITAFYREYPSASQVWVVHVVLCLADKVHLSCDQVAKQPQ